MVSTYTPNKGYDKQGTGDNPGAWGPPLNANFDIVDSNLGGTLSLVLSSSNVTLSASQAQNFFYELTGTLSANIIITFPAVGGLYVVSNLTSGAFTVTVKTAHASSNTLVIAQGHTCVFRANGEDVFIANDMADEFLVRGNLEVTGNIDLGGILNFTTPPIESQSIANSFTSRPTGTSGDQTNKQFNMTAARVVLLDSSGFTQVASSFSVTVNCATVGANGMDTGSLAGGTWYHKWIIGNGSVMAGLLSLSSTAPTMPSGYTYKMRVGAVRTDASANLLRTLQLGANAQLDFLSGSNTEKAPAIATGVQGTFSTTTPVLASFSLSSIVPPTAERILFMFNTKYDGFGAAGIMAAPANIGGGGTQNGPEGSNAFPWPLYYNTGEATHGTAEWLINPDFTIYFASNGSGGGLFGMGWKDAVNAT